MLRPEQSPPTCKTKAFFPTERLPLPDLLATAFHVRAQCACLFSSPTPSSLPAPPPSPKHDEVIVLFSWSPALYMYVCMHTCVTYSSCVSQLPSIHVPLRHNNGGVNFAVDFGFLKILYVLETQILAVFRKSRSLSWLIFKELYHWNGSTWPLIAAFRRQWLVDLPVRSHGKLKNNQVYIVGPCLK